ncbi:MAG TPA: glycosyltransferase [Burkholderiales bacterium]|nr:glycosyltransferase [Burkholderiales bacterium]
MNRSTGIVIIGRNEGERLIRALESSMSFCGNVVYVDSGSADDSIAEAAKRNAFVVELDMTLPFTAARARNAGFEKLKALFPETAFVQFLDGDCEFIDGWLGHAVRAMEENPDAGIVCGRLKERNPDRSIYNMLCDIEWDGQPGEIRECGGIFMTRSDLFDALGGFRESLIAGEEPELCLRVRREGYSILRIENDMAWHDANILHFSQWWKRALRAGHAYAEGAQLHGALPERHWVKEARSNWLWGLGLPVILIAALFDPFMIMLIIAYPLQMARIYRKSCVCRNTRERRLYALFCIISKFPQMLGQMKFILNSLRGKASGLIEYK